MTQHQKLSAVAMMSIMFCLSASKLTAMLLITKSTFVLYLQEALDEFGLESLRRYYWLVLTLLTSTSLACGACMVMMHDGMDLSFAFNQWEGTWPFNRIRV